MPTWNNPNPMANPFNSGRYSNTSRMMAGQLGINRASLEVPNQDIPPNGSPEWYEMQQKNRLEVPNQDIPLGDQCRGCGFLRGNSDWFQTGDGTVVNFKTGAIRIKQRHDGEVRWTGFNQAFNNWNEPSGPTLDQLIQNPDRYAGTAQPDGTLLEPADPISQAYWKYAAEEAEKLRSNMTEEQKAALDIFQSRFPKSKFIDEPNV